MMQYLTLPHKIMITMKNSMQDDDKLMPRWEILPTGAGFLAMTQTNVMLWAALNREVINAWIESQYLVFSVSVVDSYVS